MLLQQLCRSEAIAIVVPGNGGFRPQSRFGHPRMLRRSSDPGQMQVVQAGAVGRAKNGADVEGAADVVQESVHDCAPGVSPGRWLPTADRGGGKHGRRCAAGAARAHGAPGRYGKTEGTGFAHTLAHLEAGNFHTLATVLMVAAGPFKPTRLPRLEEKDRTGNRRIIRSYVPAHRQLQ